ncbi:MAG: ATP-binding protein [Thermoanaerobaculia bacterium]|nr:ATP-binding protein [Thermoanaerobaculia bacterium]
MAKTLQFIVYDRAHELARVPWNGERLVIGRRSDADIRVNEPTMSGLHAEILPTDDGLRLRDLNSLNGTQLNGMRVNDSAVGPGDQIQIGRARIVISHVGQAPVPMPVPPRGQVKPKEGGQDSVFTEAWGGAAQTVKIRLDHLRDPGSEFIEEDRRILLFRDLFESLKQAADADEVLSKTRQVLREAFLRSRVFILRREESDNDDTQTGIPAPDPSEIRDIWHDAAGEDLHERPPSLTFVEETISSESAILAGSLLDDQRFAASESARISGIETAMAAPTSRDGTTVAVIYVDRLGLPPFTIQDLHLLGIAANHVSAVLENVARIEALQDTNRKLRETQRNLAELNRNLEELVEERTAEIRRQADEIRILAEAKDELLGVAAHDIRGPLTVIQGTTELLRLRAGQVDGETLQRSLDMVHDAARGLSALLSELLDAKAIESGKIKLVRQRTRIRRMLESSLNVPRLAADDKKIELELDIEEDLETWADPRRLGQAMTNLVLNAVKFSDEGSRITLRGESLDDGRVLLEVQDRGPGIADEDLERIFGTFEQGEAGRQFGGSGLGLMIAKRLVELHGGQLSVDSELGVGSRFRIELPPKDPSTNPAMEVVQGQQAGP